MPVPVSGVSGSSARGAPEASDGGHCGTPEFAASIAGEPSFKWKSPFTGSTKNGSSCRLLRSCPVVSVHDDTLANRLRPRLIGGWSVEFQKMLSSESKPSMELSSTHRSASFVVRPFSIAMQSWSVQPLELPSNEKPSL